MLGLLPEFHFDEDLVVLRIWIKTWSLLDGQWIFFWAKTIQGNQVYSDINPHVIWHLWLDIQVWTKRGALFLDVQKQFHAIKTRNCNTLCLESSYISYMACKNISFVMAWTQILAIPAWRRACLKDFLLLLKRLMRRTRVCLALAHKIWSVLAEFFRAGERNGAIQHIKEKN